MFVTLKRASQQEMRTIKNFFLDYFYALSQYDDNLIINEAGLPMWKPFGLPGPQTLEESITFNWWIRDTCEHYLIRVDEAPAGFAIILTQKEHLPPGIEYELLDFYITPKYQRQGVGKEAATQTFDLHHGKWVVYELEKNLAARVFWQVVITQYTGGQYENLDDGTQQRFTN